MSERQWVTAGLFGLAGGMLGMAYFQPALWNVKLFEFVLQAVVVTGLLNMVAAFHFAANQSAQQASENTGHAFRAIEAAALAGNGAGEAVAAQRTADAAQAEADAVKAQDRREDPA